MCMRYILSLMASALLMLAPASLSAKVAGTKPETNFNSVSFATKADPLGKKLFAIRDDQGELYSVYYNSISIEYGHGRVTSSVEATFSYIVNGSEIGFFRITQIDAGGADVLGLKSLNVRLHENPALRFLSRLGGADTNPRGDGSPHELDGPPGPIDWVPPDIPLFFDLYDPSDETFLGTLEITPAMQQDQSSFLGGMMSWLGWLIGGIDKLTGDMTDEDKCHLNMGFLGVNIVTSNWLGAIWNSFKVVHYCFGVNIPLISAWLD